VRALNSPITIGRVTTTPTVQSGIAGDVFVPGDDDYDGARHAFDLAVDRRAASTQPADPAATIT
jgi:hypothetical protein